jgi:NAD+ synthase
MQSEKVIDHIVTWLKDYANNAKVNGFIIGISGGIDSALTSTLCAKTGLKIMCVEMGIHQNPNEVNRGLEHIEWLEKNYKNVSHLRINLTDTFETLKTVLPENAQTHGLSMANTRARIRMIKVIVMNIFVIHPFENQCKYLFIQIQKHYSYIFS